MTTLTITGGFHNQTATLRLSNLRAHNEGHLAAEIEPAELDQLNCPNQQTTRNPMGCTCGGIGAGLVPYSSDPTSKTFVFPLGWSELISAETEAEKIDLTNAVEQCVAWQLGDED